MHDLPMASSIIAARLNVIEDYLNWQAIISTTINFTSWIITLRLLVTINTQISCLTKYKTFLKDVTPIENLTSYPGNLAN